MSIVCHPNEASDTAPPAHFPVVHNEPEELLHLGHNWLAFFAAYQPEVDTIKYHKIPRKYH